jgi:hypothetical protein
MITSKFFAHQLFVVRQRGALKGNPAWADLTIDSNRSLSKELAGGAGLYAIHFRADLLYVGKFCGKRSNPFDGRVCDIRWSRHIGSLTMRDRRISLSAGRCKQLRGTTPPLIDITRAMTATTIHQNRGRATSKNRALFAAEHWAEFARIQDHGGLQEFHFTYTKIEPADGVDRTQIRNIVSQAERQAIDTLQPRCNGEVREGCGQNATVSEVVAVFTETLKHAITTTGGGHQRPPTPPQKPVVGMSDDHEPPNGNHGDGLEGPDDSADETAEELFWGRIENEQGAQVAIDRLIEALSSVDDADVHFTKTDGADLRVHSLVGPRARLNVVRFAWQPRLRRFTSEIRLPAQTCLALGATQARSNHAGKGLPTLATFDPDGAPDALRHCALAAVEMYRQTASC